MYELFFQKLTEKVNFSDEELNIVKIYLTPKKLRKKQYLLQEGDVCKFIAFVEKGVLRAYTIGEKGAEHIIQFALEGWLISDLYSFLMTEPATYNIDALEDSELVLISKTAHDELLKKLPKYETYIRLQLTGAYFAMQKRLTSILSLSLGAIKPRPMTWRGTTKKPAPATALFLINLLLELFIYVRIKNL